jgi:hypothetical protein
MDPQNPNLGCLKLSCIQKTNIASEFIIHTFLTAYFSIICTYYMQPNPSSNPFTLTGSKVFGYLFAGCCMIWLLAIICIILLKKKNQQVETNNSSRAQLFLAQDPLEYFIIKLFLICALIAGTLLLESKFNLASPLFFAIALTTFMILYGYDTKRLKQNNDSRWTIIGGISFFLFLEASAAFTFYLSVNLPNKIPYHILPTVSAIAAMAASMTAILSLLKYCCENVNQPRVSYSHISVDAEIDDQLQSRQLFENTEISQILDQSQNCITL